MLNYLEAFISLSNTLSFSKTAQNLKISQPCISRQIRLLEEQLSIQLFLRSRHQVVLTQKGREFRNKTAPLYSSLSEAIREQVGDDGEFSGTLSIGSMAEVGQFYIVNKAMEFVNNYPQITLKMEYQNQSEIIDRLKSGLLDFGIISELPKGETLPAFKLMKECTVLVTKPGMKIQSESNFVCYRERDPLLQSFIKRFGKKLGIVSIKEKMFVNSHRSMIDALLLNDFCAVMPYHSVSRLVESGELSYVDGVCLESDIYLVHHYNPRMTERDKAFRTFLISEAKKQPYIAS